MFGGIVFVMVTAKKENSGRVFTDMWNDFKTKRCTVLIAFVISLVPLIFLLLNDNMKSILTNTIDKLFNVNLSVFSVDIAALAILFALFQGEKLDNNAKEAFKEQSISFIGNAIFQFVAIVIAIVNSICIPSNSDFLGITIIFIQIWAIILVFDIIVELYTLITAITNKQ